MRKGILVSIGHGESTKLITFEGESVTASRVSDQNGNSYLQIKEGKDVVAEFSSWSWWRVQPDNGVTANPLPGRLSAT